MIESSAGFSHTSKTCPAGVTAAPMRLGVAGAEELGVLELGVTELGVTELRVPAAEEAFDGWLITRACTSAQGPLQGLLLCSPL